MGNVSLDRNRYPATCFRCGEKIAALEGFVYHENLPGLRWVEGRRQRNWVMTEHEHCHEKYKGTNHHYRLTPKPIPNYESS